MTHKQGEEGRRLLPEDENFCHEWVTDTGANAAELNAAIHSFTRATQKIRAKDGRKASME